MKQPVIIRTNDNIIISFNGRKLFQPIEKYKDMTDDEIILQYIKTKNIKNNRV